MVLTPEEKTDILNRIVTEYHLEKPADLLKVDYFDAMDDLIPG